MSDILIDVAVGVVLLLLAAAAIGVVVLVMHCVATAIPDPFDYPEEPKP